MAKQPNESFRPSSGSGQSDLSQSVREAAESTLTQARQAVDQYMREAHRLYGAMESSVEATQSGRRAINGKAIDFAEMNVHATFDFAQQLVRAKDPKDLVQLQHEFLKRQVEQMNSQIKELGEQATETTRSATEALRPKS